MTAHIVAAKTRIPRVRAIPRERLNTLLATVWERRLGLVTGPAGAGKTTLLAQFANSVGVPVAWYRAQRSETSESAFLGYLEHALKAALPGLTDGWAGVEDAAAALDRWPADRALLIVDDLQTLQGSPAEEALERFVQYMPPTVAVLAAGRRTPGFDLATRRVTGELLEIDADDLRFRSWEVERLFRDFYGQTLRPEELATLARRTEGWAAGLQLFHLASRDRRPDERRSMIAGLHTSTRLVREYLAANVLAHLPAQLRRFLLDTCALERLSGPRCDALLGTTGSAEILADLERGQIFTTTLDTDGEYRYHEILRSHLQTTLIGEVGEVEARRRHRQAAALLEQDGAVEEALTAYCRAEDWQAVGRLLGDDGAILADRPGDWLDLLPPALVRDDPWVLVATARRARASGQWQRAAAAYRAAEDAFGGQAGAELCRRERRALDSWLSAGVPPLHGWAGAVRQATARQPLAATTAGGDGVHARLAEGLGALLAGECRRARTLLTDSADDPDASPVLSAGARLAAGAAGLLAGAPAAVGDVEAAVEVAEELDVPWLARAGRALLALSARPYGRSEAAAVRMAAERDGDPWAVGLANLTEGLAGLWDGTARPAGLQQAANQFEALGSGVLAAWALSARALAIAGGEDPGAAAAARDAEARARALGAPGPRALAALALAHADANRRSQHQSLAVALAEACGLALPPVGVAPPGGLRIEIRCFGGFVLAVDGKPADLSAARPRVRTLLRILALHAGGLLHREALLAALWPDEDAESGTRKLHVAVSSLRKLLQATGTPATVRRDGDAYRLQLPSGADVDLIAFDRARNAARTANSDRGAAAAALGDALDLYHGELFPEDGPAEWVVGPRERYRNHAVQAAETLAEIEIGRGLPREAARACARGLAIDQYRDTLWRRLIEVQEMVGDLAAAERDRRRYEAVLVELGLPSPGADVA